MKTSFITKKWFYLFSAIILLASILRLYDLGKTPLGLEWDEVALGYDAYSLYKTGRDQFGSFLPLTFRSIDDYKPPLYEYITVPTVALFDLNEFATRLPSALAGIITVILTGLLSYKLASSIDPLRSNAHKISLVSSLFIAISPWHLQFSRAAFEVNISVLITVLAVSAFLIGLKNKKLFLFSALFFGLNLFSYHSTRVVSPLLMLSLFILFHKSLPARKYILYFFIIWLAFFISFIPILISKEAQIRFSATNIFKPGARSLTDRDLETIFYEKRNQDKLAGFELAGKIFHNQRLIYTHYETLKLVFSNYLSHFDFEYLFIKADAPLHHAPGFGLLYIVELPLILLGLIYILKKGLNRYSFLILLWIMFVPIPSSITKGAPHAVRTEIILPTFQILSGWGLILLINFLQKESKLFRDAGSALISIAFLMNISFYLHQYYVHTNYEASSYWLHSRKEAVEATEMLKNQYDRVLISPRVEVPLDFWLFYTKYSPEKYLNEGGTISGGFAADRNHFDKYEFNYFDYNNLPRDQKILLVGTNNSQPNDFPGVANVIKTIYNRDGTTALLFAENRQD